MDLEAWATNEQQGAAKERSHAAWTDSHAQKVVHLQARVMCILRGRYPSLAAPCTADVDIGRRQVHLGPT